MEADLVEIEILREPTTVASGLMRSVGVVWRRAGLNGLVSLKGGLKTVVIRQLKALGIVGFPIPKYDAQICTWQPQKTSASG